MASEGDDELSIDGDSLHLGGAKNDPMEQRESFIAAPAENLRENAKGIFFSGWTNLSVEQIKAQLRDEEFNGCYREGRELYDDYVIGDNKMARRNPVSGTYVGFFPHKVTNTIFPAKIFPSQIPAQKVINELSINAKLRPIKQRLPGCVPEAGDFFIEIKDIYYQPQNPEMTFAVVYSKVADEELEELNEKDIINEEMAAELFKNVCQGLEVLHKQEFVHCDIRPGNLMKSTRNKVYIINFGCTRKEKDPVSFGCSAKYASPEQIRNLLRAKDSLSHFEAIGKSSDYWSLGMSIAAKILGHEAFGFESIDGLTSEYFTNPRIKAASDQVVDLLCKLLEYDKDLRMYNAFSIRREKSKIVDDDWFKKHNEEKEDRDGKTPVYSIWRRVGGEEHRMASRVFWVTQIAELESKVMGQIKKREKMLELRVVEHPREAYGRIKPDKVTNVSLTEQNINSLDTIKCLLVFYSYTE